MLEMSDEINNILMDTSKKVRNLYILNTFDNIYIDTI